MATVTPIKNRAALYLRSSKDRSDVSIDSQRRELTKLATDRGFSITQEYSDAVESAKDDRRPAFQQLRADMRSRGRPWDVLLMLDPSRLSRNQYVAHVFSHECRARGVQVIYAHMPASDPLVEIVVLPLMHAIAELHSHDSKQKGLAGMAENVRQGWRAGGKAPVGLSTHCVDVSSVFLGSQRRLPRCPLGCVDLRPLLGRGRVAALGGHGGQDVAHLGGGGGHVRSELHGGDGPGEQVTRGGCHGRAP